MKKILSLLLVLVMVMTIAGCAKEEPAKESASSSTEKKEEAKAEKAEEKSGPLKVGFAQSGNPNPWMVALTESMEDEAGKQGVEYVYTDANDDMATHVSNIEDMLAQGIDYLVVAPIENTGLESVLESAQEAGIPVILTGRTTSGPWVTTVYSDQAWEGERCAEIVGADMPAAKIVELRGIEGTSSVEGRAAGFRKIMDAQFPDMEITVEQTANFNMTEAMDVMANIIESQGAENIDYVFAHNDGMALGAIQAIKDAGLTPGTDIKIVSIDGQKEALDSIIAGEMVASVQCSPKMGPTVFEVIDAIEKGAAVGKETIVPDKIFTIDNAEDSYEWAF